MKVTYYTVSDYSNIQVPKELEYRNFPSFDAAIKATKKAYSSPFSKLNSSLISMLDDLVVYGQREQQAVIGFKKKRVKGKTEEIPIYETEKYNAVIQSYLEYNTRKKDFYSGDNVRDKKGYFITKIGEIKEEIGENKICWTAPLLVQFWKAGRSFSPEVKQDGIPYSAAKIEIVNEVAISDWLPIYCTPASRYYSNGKFYLDKLSCGSYDVCEEYFLTNSIHISKVELEIED